MKGSGWKKTPGNSQDDFFLATRRRGQDDY
jgi:hypothetical protein